MSQSMEKKPVVILGAGGLGKLALEIFQSNDVDVYCFLDDREDMHQSQIGEVSVMGFTDDENLLSIIGKKCDAFVSTDESGYRESLTDLLKENRKTIPINAVHKKADISAYAEIGYGNLLAAGTIISAFAKVKNHCIIHANALVDFESEINDFVQIGAGAVVNSSVEIGKGAFVGSGAIIVSGVKIGDNARIGAGAVVIKDVPDGATLFGNPAEEIK